MPYRRKKLTFAISSFDEFLFICRMHDYANRMSFDILEEVQKCFEDCYISLVINLNDETSFHYTFCQRQIN